MVHDMIIKFILLTNIPDNAKFESMSKVRDIIIKFITLTLIPNEEIIQKYVKGALKKQNLLRTSVYRTRRKIRYDAIK